MTDDLDAFPSGDLSARIEEERRLLDAVAGPVVTDGPRRVGPDVPAGELIMAIVYASRSGGRGHVVSIIETTEGRAAMCICEAMRTLHRRPKGCWAMVHSRAIAGIDQP